MQLVAKIQITEMETFKEFLGLIEQYFDELPKELQERIMAIEYTGIRDMTADDARDLYGVCKVYENSLGLDRIKTINKMLKRVVYLDNFIQVETYPEHFWHSFDGKKVIEW